MRSAAIRFGILGGCLTLLCVSCGSEAPLGLKTDEVARQALGSDWVYWADDVFTNSPPRVSGMSSGSNLYIWNEGTVGIERTSKYQGANQPFSVPSYWYNRYADGPPSVAPSLGYLHGEALAWRYSGLVLVVAETCQVSYPPGVVCDVDERYNGVCGYTVPTGEIDSEPAIAVYATPSGGAEYFVFGRRGSDGKLIYARCSSSTRNPCNCDGPFSHNFYTVLDGASKSGSHVAVVSPTPNRVDIFVRGTDDQLWWKTLSVTTNAFGGTVETFTQWTPLGMSFWDNFGFITSPSVGSRGANSLDVCTLGSGQSVRCRSTTNSGATWSAERTCSTPGPPWTGSNYDTTPGVTALGADLWVFERGLQYYPDHTSSHGIAVRVCN